MRGTRRKIGASVAAAWLPFSAVTAATPAPAATVASTSAACRSGWVALTFDDGPSSFRPRTLEILRSARVPATFFDMGVRVAANPQLTRFAAREGHLVLNHTYDHPPLAALSPAALRAEIRGTEAAIRAAGVRMRFRGVRPPFLAVDDRVRAELARIGYRTVVGADVVTDEDSDAATTPAQIRATVLAGLAPNAIVLLHDGNVDTPAGASAVTALPGILRAIHARGYCFGTISRHGTVVPAGRLTPSGHPVPRIVDPVPYLPLVEDLRGDPPQDPPQPYVVVPSPHAPIAGS
jgi:peptidoglycan/xylan/chitin deacetylase (PgdA/CDA1 family)